MNITKRGSKNVSKPPDTQLTREEGELLIHLMTVGASETMLADEMTGWPEAKRAESWQLIAEYFRACADFNPQLELGKSMARLNMLFLNSSKIQDFKTCLSIQKEINKLLSLHVRGT